MDEGQEWAINGCMCRHYAHIANRGGWEGIMGWEGFLGHE